MTDQISKPDDAKPPQNSALARQHLVAIGRESAVRFRLIMDDPDRKDARGFRPVEIVGTLDEHAQQLRRRNDAGYGVFYQVNSSDGMGAKAENIRGATCFFVDFDGTPLENVARLPLVPHVEVATSPGKRHYYWRVDGIPLHEFTPIQKRLIALFDSDKSIHDLPRIMRLPGFLHCKNPQAPTLVEIVSSTDALPYSHRQFVAALEAAEATHGIAPPGGSSPPTKQLPASILPPTDAATAANLRQDESALRHIMAVGMLDIDERAEWIRLGIALKSSRGEPGFPVFVRLSAEGKKFEGEGDCRKHWDTFRDDRPDGKKLTMATFYGIASANGWKNAGPATSDSSDDSNISGGSGRGKTDAAVVVIDLAEEAGDVFWTDKSGRAFVTFSIEMQGVRRRLSERIDSELYRGEIAERYLAETGKKALVGAQAELAISMLEHRARTHGETREAAIRVGGDHRAIFVDLGRPDGKIARIDDLGYMIVDTAPVTFVRGRGGDPRSRLSPACDIDHHAARGRGCGGRAWPRRRVKLKRGNGS